MTQELVSFTCGRCGGALERKSDGVFACRYCGRKWEKEIIDNHEKMFETVDAALREQRRADLAALARRRYEEAHKEYVSNVELRGICNQILNLNPEDFYARFYLATCKEDSSLAEFLASVDIAAHYYDIEDMLNFLIRGLQASWINAVSTLIENAYKSNDLEKYNIYRTRFEEMADEVENGIFEPTLPRDVFIAYSSRDMGKVSELLYVLEEENGLSCFVAARNLRHGSGAVENYREAIQTALRNCKAVVFISSVSSRNSRCEAIRELNYIKENLPEMRRIELLAENYKGIAAERIFTEFFDGLEYCTSAKEVAARYFDTSAKTQAVPKKAPAKAAKPKAEAGALEASPLSDFVLKKSFFKKTCVLKKYKGNAKDVVIPDIVTSIGENAFNSCQSLRSVVIPGSVTTIETGAFAGCNGLKDVTIEDGVISIEQHAFNGCNGLKSIVIPDSVTTIGAQAFRGCHALEHVTLSADLISIGNMAFGECISLTDVVIPNGVTKIDEGAFYGCSSLASVTISDSVAEIGQNAFKNCIGLKSIILPTSVAVIGRDAFNGCANMKTIYCEAVRKPDGWIDYGAYQWYGFCQAKIVWGYKG